MNQWDSLSSYFDTNKNASEIDPGAADNILIAWPSLLKGIRQVQEHGDGLKALDFGCGAGSFCFELQKNGYDVVGSDSSPGMVDVARKNVGDTIPVYLGDIHDVQNLKEQPFDLVTAVMVFQFIENIQEVLSLVSLVTKEGGVLAFAIFNPDFIGPNSGSEKLFADFDDVENPRKGNMTPTNGVSIPVFIRREEEYGHILNLLGFKRMYAEKPAFTEAFLSAYPSGFDTSYPEYLVLVYQKMPQLN